jgi:integrase
MREGWAIFAGEGEYRELDDEGRFAPVTPRRTERQMRYRTTVKHIVGTLKRILDVAQDDQAIAANPVIANRRRTIKGQNTFVHRPLTANQVAGVYDWVVRNGSQGRGNQIHALAILFDRAR